MAITICGSCVEFGSFTMCDTSPGFSFPGVIKAESGFGLAGTHAQGSVSGYSSGGYAPPSMRNIIDKFPFASDGNATDVGDLTQSRNSSGGQSSTVSGYNAGGSVGPSAFAPSDTIDKFPFSSDTNATDVGEITLGRDGVTGASSTVSGYSAAGYRTPGFPPGGNQNIIDKFPFASDANATDVGDLTLGRRDAAGSSSTVSGYVAGGVQNATGESLEKFSFASDGNGTDVGEIAVSPYVVDAAGHQSAVNGYLSGGSFALSCIFKFPFASDAPATNVASLSTTRCAAAGQSSVNNAYTSGGDRGSPPLKLTSIDKFPFASDANATDVGDITPPARIRPRGQQF